jgi:hypothetical protein
MGFTMAHVPWMGLFFRLLVADLLLSMARRVYAPVLFSDLVDSMDYLLRLACMARVLQHQFGSSITPPKID